MIVRPMDSLFTSTGWRTAGWILELRLMSPCDAPRALQKIREDPEGTEESARFDEEVKED